MAARDALLPMTRTLLFGPGEFLVSRLASVPSPLVPMLFVSWIGLMRFAAYKLRIVRCKRGGDLVILRAVNKLVYIFEQINL